MKMRVVLASLSFALALTLPLKTFAETDISGSYKCTGTDPFQKSNYQSDLNITKLGDTYALKWGQSGKDFGGTGIISKTQANILAAEFWSPANNNNSGVILFQIQADGTLDGNWAIADQALIGSETCKKVVATAP